MNKVFGTLSGVNTTKMEESKGGFTYLSWSDAWTAVSEKFDDVSFEKHTFEIESNHPDHGGKRTLPYMMDQFGNCYVMVTVTIQGKAITEVYPVLDHRNKPVKGGDSFLVNKALQRCLTKCLAYHGLGIHIYRGEDFPDD